MVLQLAPALLISIFCLRRLPSRSVYWYHLILQVLRYSFFMATLNETCCFSEVNLPRGIGWIIYRRRLESLSDSYTALRSSDPGDGRPELQFGHRDFFFSCPLYFFPFSLFFCTPSSFSLPYFNLTVVVETKYYNNIAFVTLHIIDL